MTRLMLAMLLLVVVNAVDLRRCFAMRRLDTRSSTHARIRMHCKESEDGDGTLKTASIAREPVAATVAVRGFDKGTSEERIRNHLSKAGPISNVILLTTNAALVTFGSDAEAAIAARSLNGTTIDGNTRFIAVDVDRGQQATVAKVPDMKKRRVTAAPKAWTVLVRGFDKDTNATAIKLHCGKAGSVVKVEMVQGRGNTALVTYNSDADMESIVASLHKTTLAGNKRYIDVMVDRGFF